MSEPTEQQVETVARAIIEAWERIADVPFPLYDREADELARAALSAAAPRQAEGWQPGDRRCVECDSGLEPEWVYCPFCAKLGGRLSAVGETSDQRRTK